MAETRQAGTLARTHEGKPGLPRGRSHLPPPAVSASQRERLLRSVIAAVSECGYQAATVANIVRRARVSRKAFYAHFANKEECFLAATGEGRELMIARAVSASRALPAGARRRGPAPRRMPRVPRVPRRRARVRPGLLHPHAGRGRAGGQPARRRDPQFRRAEPAGGTSGRAGGTRTGRPSRPRRTWRWPGPPRNWPGPWSTRAGPMPCPNSRTRSWRSTSRFSRAARGRRACDDGLLPEAHGDWPVRRGAGRRPLRGRPETVRVPGPGAMGASRCLPFRCVRCRRS